MTQGMWSSKAESLWIGKRPLSLLFPSPLSGHRHLGRAYSCGRSLRSTSGCATRVSLAWGGRFHGACKVRLPCLLSRLLILTPLVALRWFGPGESLPASVAAFPSMPSPFFAARCLLHRSLVSLIFCARSLDVF